MKKYCNKHFGAYEAIEGCLYCDTQEPKLEKAKAFKMTHTRRWSNEDWPDWLNMAWQLDRSEPGALYPLLHNPSFLGLNTRQGREIIQYGDYIVCGDNGELALCDGTLFEEVYEIA